jgi:hypothetical protein
VTIRANVYQEPSELDEVLEFIVALIRDAGDATPIQIGREYLKTFGGGSPPLILFVPEADGDVSDEALETGHAGSAEDACGVHIRGAEDGSDVGRYRSAYALRRRVMSAIRRACSGRMGKPGFRKYAPSSPLMVDSGMGADISFTFVYKHDIRADEAIAEVSPAPIDTTPPRPVAPPGQPAGRVAIAIGTNPQE